MKTIKINLSDSSAVENAIKEIEAYQKELMSKIKLYVETLAQDGVAVANARLGSTVGDSTQGSIGFGIDDSGNIVKATISLGGKDALFIEFGAGIYYNNGNAHPKAAEFGYGVGTYPSKTPPNKAINPGYWWYRDDGGNLRFSIGTQASMPIYHAAETMRNNAIMRASEIFRS